MHPHGAHSLWLRLTWQQVAGQGSVGPRGGPLIYHWRLPPGKASRRDSLSWVLRTDFPGAQLVKNPCAMWETWVRSLGQEDPLEKGKAPHSSVLAWRIPWTVQPMRLQRNGNNWATHFHFYFFPQNRSKSHSYKKQIVSKGEKGGGINWEIEIDCITQEILLITLTYVGIES